MDPLARGHENRSTKAIEDRIDAAIVRDRLISIEGLLREHLEASALADPLPCLQFSEPCDEIVMALAEAQLQMEPPVKNTANPFYKSVYADLAEIRRVSTKPLANVGIAVLWGQRHLGYRLATFIEHQQPVEREVARIMVECRLAKGNQWIASRMEADCKGFGVHDLAGGMTYLKRQLLQSVLGLAAEEDDDGNAAQVGSSAARTAAPAQASRAPQSQGPPTQSATPAELDELRTEILQRVGGEIDAAQQLLSEITSWMSGGKPVAGVRRVDMIRSRKVLELAWHNLRAHETFGDAAFAKDKVEAEREAGAGREIE